MDWDNVVGSKSGLMRDPCRNCGCRDPLGRTRRDTLGPN
jgi:hypothetical protein